ncbi:unnamed protein product [Blepharisma stoltei]|uniref:Uncharacterized protein n=1 Tax=Blepharisma stoltei TaxID=1481888 RepID=A0AAU9J1M8_9CILI|nr:unnamed protein product [Blepharisma stoltei]
MSRRTLRKRMPDAEYLIGYVEDNEPIEKIMKKFKQLEEYQTKVGRDNLTSEDCRELIESTSIGEIQSSFRPRYEFSDISSMSSDSDSEGTDSTRQAKYVDPVTQSYMAVQKNLGEGRVIHEDVFNLNFQEKFEAILINAPDGLNIRAKGKLKYLKGLMNKGLIFLWSQKKEIKEWVEVMEKMKYQYVENLVWVQVDQTNVDAAGGLVNLTDFTPNLISKQPGWPFATSHLTLLMFRKIASGKLELRHQRTCDVVFDFTKPKNYVYHMIETLLPEAGVKLELWADGESRDGWIHVVHEEN